MSYEWRYYVQKRKKQIMEELGLTEADWKYYEEHVGDFCSASDSEIKFVEGESCNVDAVVKSMEDYTLMTMTTKVIEETFAKLGYVPENKRKKKKKNPEEEEPVEKPSEEKTANELEEETETQTQTQETGQ